MSDLVEKVGAALFGQPGIIGEDQIRAAIAVVLADMLDQYKEPNWPQFRAVLKMYARENGVSLDD